MNSCCTLCVHNFEHNEQVNFGKLLKSITSTIKSKHNAPKPITVYIYYMGTTVYCIIMGTTVCTIQQYYG